MTTRAGVPTQPGLQARQLIGQKVGEYEVVRLIGEGGMGRVYEGVHPLIGKHVAIKVLDRPLAGDAETARRFMNEARAVNQIGHRSLVDVFGFGRLDDGRLYYVMELLAGQSLSTWLRQHGRRPPGEVALLVHKIASGLQAAHEHGIVHRDLKLENVFLVERGTHYTVKLLDFGIAKLQGEAPDPAARTRPGAAMGTPGYMAPEQCVSASDVDHRADVYSLGILAYELLAGVPPFGGANWIEIIHQQMHEPPPPLARHGVEASPAVEAVLQRALAKRPSDRWDSVAVFADAFSAAVEATETGRGRGASRFRLLSAAGIALGVFGLLVALWGGRAIHRSAAAQPQAIGGLPATAPPAASATAVAPDEADRGAPGAADALLQPPAPATPARRLRQLDQRALTAVFQRHVAEVRGCLEGSPAALRFQIGYTVRHDGTVGEVTLSPPEIATTSAGRCIRAEVQKLRYPPHADESVRFTVPIQTKVSRP